MATTTATITITSTDLITDSLSLTTSCTLTAAGGATGLTSTSGLGRKTLASGHATYTLFDGADYTDDKAHKLYLKNTSTNAAEYFEIIINSEQVGRIYAGDWAFFPWNNHDGAADIKITPSESTSMTLEYMLLTD